MNHYADFTARHGVICACESHRCSRMSIKSVSMARWARGSRGSCSSRRTSWAINAIQVDVVDTGGGAKWCILIDIQNLPDHQCTRAWVIRLHKTLEAIHRIRRIDNQDAVSREIGQLDANKKADFAALHGAIRACESDGILRARIESVGMTRWSCNTCNTGRTRCSRCSRGARGARGSRGACRACSSCGS